MTFISRGPLQSASFAKEKYGERMTGRRRIFHMQMRISGDETSDIDNAVPGLIF